MLIFRPPIYMILMSLLIRNIRTLVHTEAKPAIKIAGKKMAEMESADNAYLFISNGLIKSFGSMAELPENLSADKMIDATGRCVFPSWVDSHTHIVFAGSREMEFAERIKGTSYEEIAKRGGGIMNSARKLRQASEEELYDSASERLNDIIKTGTGTVEIKSGYGLTLESELKMLRVIRRLKENSPLAIKATFLGAHAIPEEFKNRKDQYIDFLISTVLPSVASEGLADYCDIFCERNYFTPDDALKLFEAAASYNIKPKVHAEQLSHSGGIAAGIKAGAVSVDHLEYADESDIDAILNSETIPVLLPGAQLFLGLPAPPARKMIDSGLAVALSSDYNPGSCPSGNMNQMVSLACILYGMTPEEAIVAATTNSACAIELSETTGSIAVGKIANLFITRPIPSYSFLPYSFGSNLIDKTILNGKEI
jgi:imidazolonepropionase